ncbi:hypothetical protein BDA99DRAFT_486118 [Phascolomyces articulosus]|uniref:NADH:flavin oxidoreductase/NADH oxidase N-terminal domain-containing protein n=1 Tax=Phascolomyces articulosus TaxID=60185 RepID=A0AAD5PB31_9FUNG|nr:hypothetical protein BDA99DRAFT_486118 [Phascolomyces articulosus]
MIASSPSSSSFVSSALFNPIQIGTHTLEHRIVLCPLNRRRCNEQYAPTDSMVKYYQQRTTPGGLVIGEATMVSATAGAYPFAPGIYTEHQIAQWHKVTDAIHGKKGIVFLQIRHAVRASTTQFLPPGAKLVSASTIPVPGHNELGNDFEIPHALTKQEINDIVNDFVQAAKNAIAAGFDGVEIHGANGKSYLLDQFLNSSSNIRTDVYGGSIENRARFTLQVVKAVTGAIGVERTAIRFSPWSEFLGMEDEKPYETWSYLVNQLEQDYPSMAYIHFIEPRDDFSRKTKNDTQNSLNPFRKLWSGPFISAGGYTTKPDLAFEVASKTGNLIAFGRSFIANPDLVERLKHDWPLNPYNRATFYKGGDEGYINYPFYNSATTAEVDVTKA